jgi:hypothetical protein
MKYYKFTKIKKGENPIIRVTYKTWLGTLVEKDICLPHRESSFWEYMDGGGGLPMSKLSPINTFHENNEDEYLINGNN